MWLGLGLLHEEDKDYTTARDAYRAALEVYPTHPPPTHSFDENTCLFSPSLGLHLVIARACPFTFHPPPLPSSSSASRWAPTRVRSWAW